MSEQEKKVSACVPVTEREAINFGRGGYYAPEGTPEHLRDMQNRSATTYYTEKAFREGVEEQGTFPLPEVSFRTVEPGELHPEITTLSLSTGVKPETKAHVEVYIDSSLSNIDPAMLQMRPEGFGVSVLSDFDKKAGFSWSIDMASLRPSQAHADRAREAIMCINEGLAMEVPITADLPTMPIRDFFKNWTTHIETHGKPEVGEDVTEMAQKILDETGMTPAELIQNSSVNDTVEATVAITDLSGVLETPLMANDLTGILPDEFDPDNAEHAGMLQEAIEQGKIIDTDAVMQKPAMIKGEDIRETAVPIPTDLIREFFTNKGIYYLVDYQKSRLKGSNFLTYLTNLNVPTDVIFGDRMEYDEYSELMQAYLNQRSVIACPLLHVMAAEMLLFAKGFPRELTPYMTPMPIDSYLYRFVDENKEQINRWLHFIDSTQVFALSAIKRLNEHYKPAEIFPVIDDKEYVGSNIAQLYRIPEFIAYYFSMEDKGIKYELSYFKPQFEEYMFKNERLAHYFRSPHNYAAMMFEHVATGSFKGSEVGLGLFNIGVYAPDYKGPEYDGSAYAPKDR